MGSLLILTTALGVACSKTETVTVPAGSSSTPEASLCTATTTFSDPVTITGSTQFQVRPFDATYGLGNPTVGGVIKYAEVSLTDSSGTVVQCGTTDSSGNFSITGQRGQTYTVSVNSRASNSHINVSVLDTPTTNSYYSVKATVSTSTAGSAVSAGTLTASAKGSIVGGAFNIMYNILRANEALRAHVCGSDSNVDATCAGFSVAPKVTVYWKPGVNPYVYFGGSATSGLSFYVPGTDKLYILGGINGDTDNSDTDHFDDSVISHEYGHFIEDHFAKTDSPGGSHDGNHILDARLVWGEGWANFFSSFVRGDKMYRDTYGNIDGTTHGVFFNYDVDLNSNSGSPLDVAASTGEGNFREFAITRALWDVMDPVPLPGGGTAGANGGVGDDNLTESTTQSFTNFWNVFHGQFPSSSLHFRNVGLFLLNNPSAVSSTTAVSFQKIVPDLRDYARPLPTTTAGSATQPCNSSTTISITANDPASCMLGGVVVCTQGNLNACCSNQFASNDFYDVNNDGSISSISLSRVSGSAQLDLYLYKDGYTFGDSSTIAVMDYRTLPSSGSNPTSTSAKTITLSGLPQGHYILNVNVYTGSGNPGASTYQLFVNSNSNQVCP